jgi:CDP-diacylglycerol--serine O-phosphatidyltransferase
MKPDQIPSVPQRLRMLRPLRRRQTDIDARRARRGVYLLPSMFTMANMFCGYACIVYAMRGEFAIAAPFIGYAIVLDMLDGRVARMTGTSSTFGVELDSLADVISFGLAPAILSFRWGLEPLGRIGWAAGFLFVAAAAVRLARFNIQSGGQDKRYFVGLPSPAAAGVLTSTVYAYPAGLHLPMHAMPVLAVVIVPALLMVSTIRFRSFKTLDVQPQPRRNYTVLMLVALGLALVMANPEVTLAVMAYAYLASAFVGLAWSRLQRRHPDDPKAASAASEKDPAS